MLNVRTHRWERAVAVFTSAGRRCLLCSACGWYRGYWPRRGLCYVRDNEWATFEPPCDKQPLLQRSLLQKARAWVSRLLPEGA